MGIVVPDPEVMPEWAKKKGILGTYKDLCKNTVGGTWLKHFKTLVIIKSSPFLFIIDADNTEEFYGR